MSLAAFLEEMRHKQNMTRKGFCDKITKQAKAQAEAQGIKIDYKGFHPTQLARMIAEPDKMPSNKVLLVLSLGLGIPIEDLKSLNSGDSVSTVITQSNKEAFTSSELRVGDCYDLLELSERMNKENPEQVILTPKAIAEVLCSLDEANFNPSREFAGTPIQWARIFANDPSLTKILYVLNNSEIKIAGDVSLALYPMGGVIFSENGELVDEQIKDETLPSPLVRPSGIYDMVILNMGFSGKYNNSKNGALLIETFLEMVLYFSEKEGIVFNDLFVNVYSRDIKFYEALGFRKETQTSDKTKDSSSEKQKPVTCVLRNFSGMYPETKHAANTEFIGINIPNSEIFQGCRTLIGKISESYRNWRNLN